MPQVREKKNRCLGWGKGPARRLRRSVETVTVRAWRNRYSPDTEAFSLLEVVAATAIIGIAVAALLAAVQTGTQVNSAGRKITQAAGLVAEIREWTLKLPFSDPDPADQGKPPGSDGSDPQVFVDDLDDLLDVTYSPPRDGNGLPITDMTTWGQNIKLTWRDPDNLTTTVADGSTNVLHVEVGITCRGEEVLTTGWLVARRK